MKNYKIWLGIVLTLLLVNSVVLGIMWFHKRQRPMMMPDNHEQHTMEPKDLLSKTLAFTPKQAELFATMRTKHHELTSKLNEENHKLRDSLFINIKKDKIDSAAINAITKKISDNQVQIEKATLYHFRELRSILTADQKVKFDGIINDVVKMMGRPGGMQPPPNNGGQPGEHHGYRERPEHGRPGMPPPDRERMRMHQGPPPEGMPPDSARRGGHFGPPPDGMPPPGDRRKGHRPPPPPDGMPPEGPPPAK